jgi:hypothetical protein
MTDLPPSPDLPDSLTDLLIKADDSLDRDHAHLLAEVINLYHEACRRTRLGTKLGADDIGKIMTIFNLLTEVGVVEKGIAELVGRPQRGPQP